MRRRRLAGSGLLRPPTDRSSREIVARTSDQIVAAIFSLSSSTPYLFGDRRDAFEADLRQLLHETNSNDLFSEHMQEIPAEIWRR